MDGVEIEIDEKRGFECFTNIKTHPRAPAVNFAEHRGRLL